MTSSDMVGINPSEARRLAAQASSWGGDIDGIVGLINEAVAMSDVSCAAGSMLYQIASDGRAIAGSIRSAVDQIEGFTIDLDTSFTGITSPAMPWGMGFEPGLDPGTEAPQQGALTLQQAIDQAGQQWAMPVGATATTAPTGHADEGHADEADEVDLQAAIDDVSNQWSVPLLFRDAPGSGAPSSTSTGTSGGYDSTDSQRWGATSTTTAEASNPAVAPGSIDLNAAIAAANQQWALPIGPLREVDRRVAELNEIDALLQLADQTERPGEDIWDFTGAQGETNAAANAEAARLRQEAWDRAVAMGEDPQVVLGALAFGEATNREIARALEIERAQRLHDTASSLAGTPLAFEGEQMLAEANQILNELYLTTESKEVLDRFGSQLDPYEIAAVVGYVTQTGSTASPVLDADDPVRVLEVIAQGYSQQAAIDHVTNAPAGGLGTMTFVELEAELARLEANGQDNTYEFDATLRELNDRTETMAGDIYVLADLDVIRTADRAGVSYADALAVAISERLDQVGGPPGAQAAQIAAIEADLATLVELRNEEALAAAIASIENSPGDELTRQMAIAEAHAALPDPAQEAARLRAIMGTGTNIFFAETLSAAMGDDIAPWEAARITREINGLVDDDMALDIAITLAIDADRLGMTVAEYQDYQDAEIAHEASPLGQAETSLEEIRALLDTARQDQGHGIGHADSDSIWSTNDLRAMIENEHGYYTPAQVEHAQIVLAMIESSPDAREHLGITESGGGWSFADIGHLTLDIVGMVPVVGNAADAINATWYLAEGKYLDAALSSLALIPVIGAAVVGVRGVIKARAAGKTFNSLDEALIWARAQLDELGILGRNSDEAGGAIARNSDDVLRSNGDPMRAVQGPAKGTPEFNQLVKELEDLGFEVEERVGAIAYSPAKGSPGKIIVDPDASMSAVRHEAQHALDDAANGFPGMGYYSENMDARWAMEERAYDMEIQLARDAGREDIAQVLITNKNAEYRAVYRLDEG